MEATPIRLHDAAVVPTASKCLRPGLIQGRQRLEVAREEEGVNMQKAEMNVEADE